jgi:hypothetical protein
VLNPNAKNKMKNKTIPHSQNNSKIKYQNHRKRLLIVKQEFVK